ncbi:hypothetical protein C8256_12495 [Kluyvera genomosp. 2]|uniref:Uncharacterized protein n=1 Tax=Kluyvera genomosp. 2 TaxID=2774054 RepID=A0A2T2Y1S5_9ENTR|nr:hypothetical protein C8256_12495 [Kluyvera genomosp. 2]
MTSQSIRFFAMSLKGLTSYYNCVKNSVRILYIQFLSKLSFEKPPSMIFARSLQCTLRVNAHAKSPAYEL